MNIGWVQIHNNTITHSYSSRIRLWPSSYKAELLAILSAISTCPRHSNIHIYTDSQSIISKYNKICNNPLPKHKQYSYSYWPIWHTLTSLVHSYQHIITLHKVQAHSNNIFNNEADKLATNHISTAYLELIYNNIYNTLYTLQYGNYTIEQPTRRAIKNICNVYIISMWSSQHRMSNIIPISS